MFGYHESVVLVLEESFLLGLRIRYQLVNVHILLLFFLPFDLWHLHRRVIVAHRVIFIIKIRHVENLIVPRFVTVVDLPPGPVAPSVLPELLRVLRLHTPSLTVSMNQEGISLSLINL